MRKIFCIFVTAIFLLTLSACKQTYYIVTFDSIGGSLVENVEVKEGSKVSKPEDPSKDKFTFVAWTLNGDVFDFNAKIEKNITLKARWSDVFTIAFNTNGGSSIDSLNVNSGSTFTAPTTTKEDYIFLGWELNGVEYDFSKKVYSNLTLDAVWSYNITKIDKFIELVSSSHIKSNITIKDTNSKIFDGTINGNKAILEGSDNDLFLEYISKEINVVNNYNKSNSISDYSFKTITNDISNNNIDVIIPLYLWGLEVSDFQKVDNKYINEEFNLEITTLGANVFVVNFDDMTYTFELKDNIEIIDEEIYQTGLISYYITDEEAIIIDEHNIKGEFTLPQQVKGKDVTQIADEAFIDSKFKGIEISSQIVKIGNKAFANSLMENIKMNTKTKIINNYAFANCVNLEIIILPLSVEEIGSYVFSDSNTLERIYLYGNSTNGSISLGENWNNGKNVSNNFDGEFIVENVIYKQDGLRAVVIGVKTQSDKIEIRSEIYGLEVVRIESLQGLTTTTLIIPETVKTIYSTAFDNISKVEEIICYSNPALFTSVKFPVEVTYK